VVNRIERAPYTPPLSPTDAPIKPSVRPEIYLLRDLNPRLKQLSDRIMGRCSDNLTRENTALTTWTTEQLDAIEEASKAASSQLSWSYLQKIGATLFNLFNIIAGTSLLASGESGGKYLLGAGVLGLANSVMDDEGWDWMAGILTAQNEEAKDKLRILLPVVSHFASLLLAANGAAELSAEHNIEAILEQIMSYVNVGLSLGKIPPKIQAVRADKRLITAEQHMSLHEKRADMVYKVLELLMQEFRRMNEAVKKTIQQTIRATNSAALASAG